MTTLKCIMHVDDNEADQEYFQDAFFMCGCQGSFITLHNGEEAIAALRNPCDTMPRPDLVILDINMPRVNGHEVLAFMKEQPHLTQIPVVMLTGSDSQGERKKSIHLGAADHCTKPVSFAEAHTLMRRLGELIDSCH